MDPAIGELKVCGTRGGSVGNKAASGGKGEASPGGMGRKKKAQGHEGCTEINSIKSRDFPLLPTFKRSAAY